MRYVGPRRGPTGQEQPPHSRGLSPVSDQRQLGLKRLSHQSPSGKARLLVGLAAQCGQALPLLRPGGGQLARYLGHWATASSFLMLVPWATVSSGHAGQCPESVSRPQLCAGMASVQSRRPLARLAGSEPPRPAVLASVREEDPTGLCPRTDSPRQNRATRFQRPVS